MPQLYLPSCKFSNAQKVSSLINIRSSYKSNFRDNFHNMHQSSLCQLCKLEADSQQHALICTVVSKHFNKEDQTIKSNVKCSDIFGDLPSQLQVVRLYQNTRRGSPVDCRPSTAEVPSMGKIHSFSKTAVTLESVMRFGCPSRFRISNKNYNIVYFMTEGIIFNH